MNDLMCQSPSWLPWIIAALPVAAHLRTLLPPQTQGPAKVVLDVLDIVFANYGHCKNQKPVSDEQDKVTPRPKD